LFNPAKLEAWLACALDLRKRLTPGEVPVFG
jgi:hypothetical protein